MSCKRGKPAAQPISAGNSLLFLPASPGTLPGYTKKTAVLAPPSDPGPTAPLTVFDYGRSVAQTFGMSRTFRISGNYLSHGFGYYRLRPRLGPFGSAELNWASSFRLASELGTLPC